MTMQDYAKARMLEADARSFEALARQPGCGDEYVRDMLCRASTLWDAAREAWAVLAGEVQPEQRAAQEPLDTGKELADLLLLAKRALAESRAELASWRQSLDLVLGPENPLPDLAKDVVRGFFVTLLRSNPRGDLPASCDGPSFPKLSCSEAGKECGFTQAGVGYQCTEGEACGRYIGPGDKHFEELDAYYRAVQGRHPDGEQPAPKGEGKLSNVDHPMLSLCVVPGGDPDPFGDSRDDEAQRLDDMFWDSEEGDR